MDPLDFDFLKDRYDFELLRKEQLTTALAPPVGILGGLGSVLAVMARSFAFREPATATAFAMMMAAAMSSFIACGVQLARAYHRQTYRFLPLLKELDDTREEWRDFYTATEYPGAEQEFFSHGFRRDIIAAADRNTENNDARSAMLYSARVWLFWLLGFTIGAGIVYIANQVMFHA